jgi:hypothetical protein
MAYLTALDWFYVYHEPHAPYSGELEGPGCRNATETLACCKVHAGPDSQQTGP